MILAPSASTLVRDIQAHAQPVTGAAGDYDGLLALIGDARFVLLGEATHGTHEFYAERQRITARLVQEKGFHAVAVEADWPDAYRVNRFIRGQGGDQHPIQALAGFQRFPHWMWRNTDVVAMIRWLREHNNARQAGERVGFYGLDLYSLFTSMEQVLHYLEQRDPATAQEARRYLACFDQHGADTQAYGYAAGMGMSPSCQQAVRSMLAALQQREAAYTQGGADAQEAYFHATQNARLIKNAEAYYRTMFSGRVSSWNLRDQHMADTLDDLADYLSAVHGEPARIVVWAHNSHLGDARATEVHGLGELNLGQLVRERYPGQSCLVGFTTHGGTVMAASDWDGDAFCKRIVPALPDSLEDVLHDTGIANFVLPLGRDGGAAALLRTERLERAIGVIYRQQTERASHYFKVKPAEQFDVLIHLDQTSPVTPLASTLLSDAEVPETYPEGL